MPTYPEDQIESLMANNTIGHLITSPQGLLDIVLECLENYQIYLTGKENPRVEDLWNSNAKKLTHKPEWAFSDHIKSFLDLTMRSSGMVINREVQLNSGRNGEPGSRTDIWVNTFLKDKSAPISLCIEVKGSWNSSARNAMEEQLVNKYIGEGGADAGIFLVGWFDSKKHPQANEWGNNKNKAIENLNEQAKSLREKGHLIAATVISCDYRL